MSAEAADAHVDDGGGWRREDGAEEYDDEAPFMALR